MARPTKYTLKLAADICAKVSDGQSMRSICKDKSLPAMSTVFLWLSKEEKFSEQYAIAKGEMVESFIEDMIDIADNQVSQPLLVDGSPVMVNKKPVMTTDSAAVNHARLRIDTRKFIAMKLKPKKYGDKADDNPPLQDIKIEIVNPYANKPD